MNSSTHHEPDIEPADEPRSRRDLLRSGGIAALGGLLGVFGLAGTASAKNGSSVRAGDKTSASRPTTIESSKGPALQARAIDKKDPIGVRGVATDGKGIGVQGTAVSSKGETVGVQGLIQSPDGVAGEFLASKGGTALRTKGRVELAERSGRTAVSEGGAEFVDPRLRRAEREGPGAGDAPGAPPGRARRGSARPRRRGGPHRGATQPGRGRADRGRLGRPGLGGRRPARWPTRHCRLSASKSWKRRLTSASSSLS